MRVEVQGQHHAPVEVRQSLRGKQLGRKLGYPTANIRLAGKRPALSGIYATWVHGIGPGPMAVTEMPRSPNSFAAARVKCSTGALAPA